MSAVETEKENGPAAGADTTPDRPEAATNGRRAWLAPVAAVLSLALAGSAWFALNRLTNVGGPDSVCDGAASADLVHELLGPGRVSDATAGYEPARNSTGSCTAIVRSGLFETSEKTVWFTVVRGTDQGPAEWAASNARLFPGGSVTPKTAWSVLPEDCGMGVRAEVDTAERGHDEARARLAVSFANAVAKARACGDQKLPAPKGLSAMGAETYPDWTNLCGLPGFAPTRDPGIPDAPDVPDVPAAFRQQATTASDPIWSCTVTDRSSSMTPQVFAITTEPRTTAVARHPHDNSGSVGRAQLVAPGTLVATCRGKDVYFTVTGGFDQSFRNRLFPDRDGLVRQFLTAGGKAIGCEPIL